MDLTDSKFLPSAHSCLFSLTPHNPTFFVIHQALPSKTTHGKTGFKLHKYCYTDKNRWHSGTPSLVTHANRLDNGNIFAYQSYRETKDSNFSQFLLN